MKYIVSGKEMKSYDNYTINTIGIPSLVLMERAALSVIKILMTKDTRLKRTLIICGTGNNGGDGVAIGRILLSKGYCCDIYICGDLERCSTETKEQIMILKNYGYNFIDHIPNVEYTTIIDALFGIGLSRNIKDTYYDIISKANDMNACKIAVDIPSGINSSTGEVMGIAFKADFTVTLSFPKIGCILYPGADYAGDLIVEDIGISKKCFSINKPLAKALEPDDISILLPKRVNYSNKGTYGKVLIIAGSENMSGAAYFSAKAAYKSGAGLVKIFTCEKNRAIIQTQIPEAVLSVYSPENDTEEQIIQDLISDIEWSDSIVIGPGIGRSLISHKILYAVLDYALKKPLVIDADAINILAENVDVIKKYKSLNVIITPHLGEMRRITGKDISFIQHNLINTCIEFADISNWICVLKDARTLISDGKSLLYINISGNNGMATAGSGDVLSGIIGAFASCMSDYLKCAALSTYIHGLAGDYSSKIYGKRALTASDIIEGLNHILTSND